MLARGLARFGLGCLALGCGAEGPGQSSVDPAEQKLAAGQAARVGSDGISTASVARIAQAQGVSLQVARDGAVRDALFAQDAPRRLSPGRIAVARRRGLARALLHDLTRKARAAGPATDAELALWTSRRWLELDRPEAVRTVHVVVLAKRPERQAPARALAMKMAEATRGAADKDDFMKRARAVSPGDANVVVQPLPAITREGRGFRLKSFSDRSGPASNFDEAFAKAANDLTEQGQQSGLVESPFGFHVIYLVERIPALQPSRKERLEAVHEDVIADRVFQVEGALRKRQGAAPVSRAFDTLTRQLIKDLGPRG